MGIQNLNLSLWLDFKSCNKVLGYKSQAKVPNTQKMVSDTTLSLVQASLLSLQSTAGEKVHLYAPWHPFPNLTVVTSHMPLPTPIS